MSSILGLPAQGTDVTILITRVHTHPLCMLVEFWGKFSLERTAEYESLAKDIQSPGNTFQDLEGSPGDQCLADIDGTWYRSRILSKNGLKYSVYLIDRGLTCSVTTSNLAWGKKEHFQLPPEVEFCVLANVLPVSSVNRWSSIALEFLKSLSGKSVSAHVQAELVPYRTFVLNIPHISKQMYEMGFARKLSPDVFQDFVLMSLQSKSQAEVSPEVQQHLNVTGEKLHKQEVFLYPELPGGTVETVIVTEVTNPQRIFCQLKVFSKELKKLSDQITQSCEGSMTTCIIGPEMIGFPCAARGSDGKWHRSVLQQVLPTNKVVEVLNVDYGTKRFVQMDKVRPLAAEFFRMPVVTYICSLHGVIDKGVGWTTSQIDYLRYLLLYKTLIAKFEYQSVSEGVHYVTLYGDDNINMNNLFGSKESSFLGCEKTLSDYAIHSTAYSHQQLAQKQTKTLTLGRTVKEQKVVAEQLPAEELSLNSTYVAVVQHVSNPSEFWIQTQNYIKELDELMDSIYHYCKDSLDKDAVRNPAVGLYCVAKAEDGDFYRATVAEVNETKIKVFFVDYGNTEVVDRSNIRTLPTKFKKLPQLALKCTLAGVRPEGKRWTAGASEFFAGTVSDKVLNVHVTAKYDDKYIVQLTDSEAQGEQDVSTLMCCSGFAKRSEMQRVGSSTQLHRRSGVYSNNEMSLLAQNTVGIADNEKSAASFKEQMFQIGSVLDVSVSHIESPNDFWCHLVQNTRNLNFLMHDIQVHYAVCEFEPHVENACVARHPDNKMWYRALVIHKHETPHVDVLFVDYGQTETVSLYDLRRICPKFLTLPGQAFRCSLLNPTNPTSAINEWNEGAIARFQNFVKNAASEFVILKCTIYAVMHSEKKIVFNIVDLETPFESICTTLVSLVKSAPPKKAARPSFRLDTYYYSTHNVKTGTEEQATVTCVNNVGEFYCQLQRNSDVLEDLRSKVNNLCHQLENVKLPSVFGTLCFAKYTDGQWYRGQIKATKPALLVQFVDYGDTIKVDKSDLLPVPLEANDIMSVPVQAVVCSLSDLPADVPSKVNSWFKTSATECSFRALVVARKPDGKLLVELYDGNTQINAKIKKMFQIERHTDERVVHQCWKPVEASGRHALKTPNAVPKQTTDKDHNQALKRMNSSASSSLHQTEDDKKSNVYPHSAQKPTHHVGKNGQKVKTAPLELYKPPHQRLSTESTSIDGSEPANVPVKARKEKLPTVTISKSPEFLKISNAGKLPKLADLPSTSVAPGMAANVYVSHCNGPSSFFVQLVREVDALSSLVEKLNDPSLVTKMNDIKDLHPGDLVQAEYSEDSSWYRAVVREIHIHAMVLVEFVDFGNAATVPMSKIRRLDQSCLQLPIYSTHCMLSDAAGVVNEGLLNPEVLSAFREDIGSSGERVFMCHFIRQVGSVWEVALEDNGVKVECKGTSRGPEITTEKLEQVTEKPTNISDINRENTENLLPNPCPLHYHQQEFLEGQQLEVYITSINDALTFWCQSANSENLDKIILSVSKVSDATDHKENDFGALLPGSPCIALFSDDQFWYRAEVIDRDGDELSVLFVDYGNMSRVNVKSVREVDPSLLEITSQAFLCELEGFDTSHGSWKSGAADHLSMLTADKTLQLTVTKVTRAQGKSKCLVWMECEGQVINKAMKTWWKGFMPEDESGKEVVTFSNKLQCDTTVDEAVVPEDQLQQSDIQEVNIALTYTNPETDHIEEHSTFAPANLQKEDEVQKMGRSPKDSECSEDSAQTASDFNFETADELQKLGRSSKNSECSEDFVQTGSDLNLVEVIDDSESTGADKKSLPAEINTAQTASDLNLVDAIDDSESIGADKKSLPAEMNTAQTASELNLETADEVQKLGRSPMTSECSEDFVQTGSDLNLVEAIDDSESTGADKKSLPAEMNTAQTASELNLETADEVQKLGRSPMTSECSEDYAQTGSDLNLVEAIDDKKSLPAEMNTSTITFFSAKAKERDGSEAMTAAKMVPRKSVSPMKSADLHETTDTVLEVSEQIQAELVLHSLMLPGQHMCDAPTEQEIEGGDGTTQEEIPCIITHIKSDSTDEDEASAHCDDTQSSLLADTVTDPIEPHTAPPPEMDDKMAEVLYCFEEGLLETCPTNAGTDLEELRDEEEATSAGGDCLNNVAAEEMNMSITRAKDNVGPHADFGAQVDVGPLEEKEDLPDTFAEKANEVQNESLEIPLRSTVMVKDTDLDPEVPCVSSPNVDNLMTEDETVALHQDKLPAFSLDTESEICRAQSPDLSTLVEEVTCLVGEITLTDTWPDSQYETETVSDDSEQWVNAPSQQSKELDDSVLLEEMSSAEDSFEAQLSMVTHLSLIVNNFAEKQSEE
ncbi:tudor domain-containing 6 [Parambassis ranga]|uniref:Tudor domain-containing 6 n=1 Tax=Parambassis ranga TaxID=210632 RepID=A0A6P7HYX2_9TELE|nr:tudor domain-containing protein 6 [Parambassis ranga]